MKTNEKGFSAVELVIILGVVLLIGAGGWFVYTRQKDTADSKQPDTGFAQESNESPKTIETVKAAPYSFKELGISMEPQPGWEVKAEPAQDQGVNFYKWTVSKSGTEATIVLASSGFRGGFEGCGDYSPLSDVSVNEILPTQNPSLMFMSWSSAGGEPTTAIVSASQESYRATNDLFAARIANKDLKTGKYFECVSEPAPGFSLGLNKEAAPGFARRDYIMINAKDGTPTETYNDLKTMMTSIK